MSGHFLQNGGRNEYHNILSVDTPLRRHQVDIKISAGALDDGRNDALDGIHIVRVKVAPDNKPVLP